MMFSNKKTKEYRKIDEPWCPSLAESWLRRLTDDAQRERDDFVRLYGDGNCSCHIFPPCSSCVHPGNPLNQEEEDECWEYE